MAQQELLIRALYQVLARFTYFLATINTRFTNLIQRRITRQFDKYSLVENSFEANSPTEKFAVLALFPRRPLKNSVLRLITVLHDNDYQIVAVINDSKDKNEMNSWMADLRRVGATIIVRTNIGRDFAAYRAGFRFLQKNHKLKLATRLLFANDSCYYGPASKGFLTSVLSENADWNGMFINYRSEFHMQSFFQVFSSAVFNNKWFAEYWEEFQSSDLRHQTIQRGELALSTLCRNKGFTPKGFVTASRILENENFNGFTQEEELAIWNGYDLAHFVTKRGREENAILFKKQFYDRSIVHHHGLVASRILSAPLKLDLFKSGFSTTEGLRQTLHAMGCEIAEREAVIDYMTRAGSPASVWGLRHLWRKYGLV